MMDWNMKALLKAGLIVETKLRRYRVSFFCVPKGEDGVRPVFDNSGQTPFATPPTFVLPNIYQVLSKHRWTPGRFSVKIDTMQSFFNIPLHSKTTQLTTFEYRGKKYMFKVLPFGMSCSPFVSQMFLNAIMKKIRLYCPDSWGHIDDILVSHRSRSKLAILAFRLKLWFKQAGWPLNITKSQLKPSKSIDFLGATWGQTGVKRSKKALPKLIKLIKTIPRLTTEKQIMRTRGYLNLPSFRRSNPSDHLHRYRIRLD